MYLGTYRVPQQHSSSAFTVYPIGDLHLDQKAFNEQRFLRYQQAIIRDPTGIAVFVGDAVEGHTPAHKHFNPDAIRRDFLAGMDEYAKLCLDTAERLLRPISKAGRGLVIVEGNHDRMLQFTGFSAMVADRCKGTYLGGEGFVNVFSGRKDHGYRTVLYCTHGSGGGKRDGSSLNAMRDYMLFAKADIYIAGHTHKGHTQIVPILGSNETGTDIIKRPVALIRTPSFIERGIKGVVTYAGRKGYPTSDERIIAVRVDPKQNKMTTFEVDCD